MTTTINIQNHLSVEATWALVWRRNGLTKRQARRLWPRVLKHALATFQVVRDAVRRELDAAVSRITGMAVALTEIEVATEVAGLDEELALLLEGT
jgi:hypothetical protein